MQDFISLGAGVQSTTMLLMAAHGEIEFNGKYAIFSDTGWEPKEVYDHLVWLIGEAKKFGIEVVIANNGNIKKDTYNALKFGSRVASMPIRTLNLDAPDPKKQKGIIMRQCTSEYKIIPVEKKIRSLIGYKPRQRIPKKSINLWMGISTDEIQRVKDSMTPWIVKEYPLVDKGFNRLDCLNWMERKGYPVPPKSSCIICPYHSNEIWLEMKRNHPEEWQEAVKFDNAIRDNYPGIRGQAFLHKSYVPLEEANINENQLSIYDDDFTNECEGICGV